MMVTLDSQLETETIALNQWLYAESVGLPLDPEGYARPAQALAHLYADWLEQATETGPRYFALENWAETRLAPLDQQLSTERDRHLSIPALACSEGPLTWRNWKAFEREAGNAEILAEAFEGLVERSALLVPILEERRAHWQADFAQQGLTPVHTWCWREGLTPEDLRAFLRQNGEANCTLFQQSLSALSQAVFGRPPGPAELRALYLNRMYEPTTPLFSNKSGKAEVNWVADTQAAFTGIGFDLSAVPVDVENRPRKYPGAFCFPIATPGDVRVSVRMASAHHLVDMLYHEFGHAVHFSGIRADLPFIDRYWIHSGTHETFSTLFESLLGEPEFWREQFGLADAVIRRLLDFHHFKMLLTRTWLAASALTTLEGWLDHLSWPEIETHFAANMLAFTGVPLPPGFARLEPFTASCSIYPAGYVLAVERVERWLAQLRQVGGTAWWRSLSARDAIREKVRAGGQVRFAS
jgi:hypothetical protein